jgi:ribosomal protein S6
MDPQAIAELERSLQLLEHVTRFMIVSEDPEVAAYEAKKLSEAER